MDSQSEQVLRLKAVNLNLLLVLDVLLFERNVTRTAQRLGVTQSAASRALAELRQLFDDPLLVRKGNEMMLTPRARDLLAPVHRGLLEFQRAMEEGPGFEPAHSTRRFRLGVSDFLAAVFLPSLLERLGQVAPKVRIDVRPFEHEGYDRQLERGGLDLCIGAEIGEFALIKRRVLYSEEFVCMVRKDHPKIRRRLTLKQYVELPHLLISPRGEGTSFVDVVLRKQGLERRIATRIPFFLLAAKVIARSDDIVTIPRQLTRVISEPGVQVLDPPVEIPAFEIMMVWHERFERDPAIVWLRQQVLEIAQALELPRRKRSN